MSRLFVLCTLTILLLSILAGGEARSELIKGNKQDAFTTEITKKDGNKMTVTNFRIDNRSGRQDLPVTMYSENITVSIPLEIISRITNSKGQLAISLGDNSTIKGHSEVGFSFDSDIGKEGISADDIKELVFKHQASSRYEASPNGKHQAHLYLKNGKQIKFTGATFLAAQFDRNPKYQYPIEIGDEYPQSVHFVSENFDTYYDLSWEQIKTIIPLKEKKGGLIDCKIIAKSGRELFAWANYWWTADRIQGIIPIGNYQLLLTLRYSGAPTSDYEKIDLN